MIRCSNISLKFSNTNKINNLKLFIDEYKYVMKLFIDILWDVDDIPRLIPKEYTNKIKKQTWLSARAIQSAAKQVSGIIRGTKKKNKQRLYIYNKLIEEGKPRKAKKLKQIIDKYQEKKPDIDTVYPELDSRFVNIDLDNKTCFDGWITLSSLGNKLKIRIPFKRTHHFNKMINRGKLKNGLRLFKDKVFFNFELPDKEKKKEGKTIGIDIGIKKVVTCSDGQLIKEDKDGWTLGKIQERLSRRKKNSKGFKKSQEHRKNYINWSINQLNFDKTNVVKIEKIKHLRRGSKTSRFMNHWTYTEIRNKLFRMCEESGVQILQTSPTYTSQRCSKCGWVRKSNRKGAQFICTSCGFAADADLNASKNIRFDLPYISNAKRLSHDNIEGFYWNVLDKGSIVSYA